MTKLIKPETLKTHGRKRFRWEHHANHFRWEHNIKQMDGGNWRLIFSLIALTAVSTLLSIAQSQIIGTYFQWVALGVIFAFYFLTGRYWRGFLVLMTALSTLSIYQAGVIIGYRSWYYISILALVYLTFRKGMNYLKMPGFRLWFMLLILGSVHLLFIQSPDAFGYSRGAVLQIATGLSIYAIAWQLFGQREYNEAIVQLSFLVMMVCSFSLLIPLYLTESEYTRIGTGIGMDANGLGITATYAFIALLFYSTLKKTKSSLILSGIFTLFLVVVLVRTGSRQSIAINLLILAFFIVITFRGKVKFRSLVILTCIFIGLSVLVSTVQMEYLETRFSRAFADEGRIDRVDHLVISLYMVKDHPLGLGGGGFKENFEYYKYKTGIQSRFSRVNPHTFFGMVIADWGLPGILLLLMGFYKLIRHVIRLQGLPFAVKTIALTTYIFLANAGMSFPPVLMALLGFRSPDE